MIKYFESVRDYLATKDGLFQKTDSLAETMMEMDITYPFYDSGVSLDSITGKNNKDVWRELNKYAKRLSAKLSDSIEPEESIFAMHHNYKVNGTGTKESKQYMPFTLALGDGQVLTALVRNSSNARKYNAKNPLVVGKWVLNKADITTAIYVGGNTELDLATTVARIAKLIESYHKQFISLNPMTDKGADIASEIDGMVLDLSNEVSLASDRLEDESEMEEGLDTPPEIVKAINPTYTLTLPIGAEKYIPFIREEFAKDEKLKDIEYAFSVNGVIMDSIDKKDVAIVGGEKAIQTHMKKIIHFITIGADKIEGKDNARMPSVDVIRNAEHVKEKTGLDYTIDHHQHATFLTARHGADVGFNGKGSIYLRPVGKNSHSSISERWLGSDFSRKKITEHLLEVLAEEGNQDTKTELAEPKTLSIKAKLKTIKPFMSKAQYKVISAGMNKEDYEFNDVTNRLHETISTMPKTYGQDGMGDKAIVYLHYFNSGSDWYVTEKDTGEEQTQAYGYTILDGDTQNAELGYISIEELTSKGVELDFHWSEQTVGEVRAKKHEANHVDELAGTTLKEIDDQEIEPEDNTKETLESILSLTTYKDMDEQYSQILDKLEKDGTEDDYGDELDLIDTKLTQLLRAENE